MDHDHNWNIKVMMQGYVYATCECGEDLEQVS